MPKANDPVDTLSIAGAAVKGVHGTCSDIQETTVCFSQVTRELQLRPAQEGHREHAQKSCGIRSHHQSA